MTIERTRIAHALAFPDPEERRRATLDLVKLPVAEAMDLLVQVLGDDDWRVRKEGANVAAMLGADPALIVRLVGLLEPTENVGQRNAAVEALAAIGGPGLAIMVNEAPRLDPNGRKLVAEVLGRAQDASAMPSLEKLAADDDSNVRIAALDAIGSLGSLAFDAATRVLSQALGSSDLQEQLAALDGLNRVGAIVAWERLAPLVDDPILERPALALAARSGRPEAAAALLRALERGVASLSRLAIIDLAQLVLRGATPMSVLDGRTLSVGPKGRAAVSEALAPGGADLDLFRAALVVAALLSLPPGLPAAVNSLSDDRLASEVDAALALYGRSALPLLLECATKGTPSLRAQAVEHLGMICEGPVDPEVLSVLRICAADRSTEVAAAAVGVLRGVGAPEDLAPVAARVSGADGGILVARSALEALARRYPEAAKALARALAHEDGGRVAVAIIIGALGDGVLGSMQADVSFLASALSSPDAAARKSAVDALGALGAEVAMDAVRFALADEEREIQISAVQALGRLRSAEGGAVGTDPLLDLLRRSADPEILAAAARALGGLGGRDHRVRDSLAPLSRSAHPAVAVAAVEGLSRLSDPQRLSYLLEAAAHPHQEVVKAALLALEEVDDSRSLDCVGRGLCHPDWEVRRLAADGLGRIRGEAAGRMLRERLRAEEEPLVREAISRALQSIEGGNGEPGWISRPPPKAEP